MRNLTWLRYALASLIVAGGGASVLVACSDDDPVTGNVPKPDSGTPDTGTDSSVPPVDGGADADAAPTPPGAKLTLVNAMVSLGPKGDFAPGVTAMRLCFKRGPTEALESGVAPYPPLPHKIREGSGAPAPGLFNGTGGAFPSLPGADLAPIYIQPYIMNARSLAEKGLVGSAVGTACDEILAPTFKVDGGALVENVDYWKLPTIPANTFKAEKSFLLVASGCAGDAVNTENCGPGMPDAGAAPGLGNLAVTVFELDRSTEIAADSMGAQFFHASGPFTFDPGSTLLSIVPALVDAPDGGGAAPLSGGNAVAYLNGTSLVQVKGLKPFITPNPTAALFTFPLEAVKGLSGLTADYALGKAYTFVLVGDKNVPVKDDAGVHPHGYHFLGFPNDPVVEGFKP